MKFKTHRQLLGLFPSGTHISVSVHCWREEQAHELYNRLENECGPPERCPSARRFALKRPGIDVSIDVYDSQCRWSGLAEDDLAPLDPPEPVEVFDEN